MADRGDYGYNKHSLRQTWESDLNVFVLGMACKLSENIHEKGQPTKKDGLRNCSPSYLKKKLQEHLNAGNFVDVANFAFLLSQLNVTDSTEKKQP